MMADAGKKYNWEKLQCQTSMKQWQTWLIVSAKNVDNIFSDNSQLRRQLLERTLDVLLAEWSLNDWLSQSESNFGGRVELGLGVG